MWVIKRYAWLEKHFGFDMDHVAHTSAKHIIDGRWLVEDNWDQLLRWSKFHPTGTPILWSTPNNRHVGHNLIRVNNWTEATRIIEEGVR